jgi:flavin-dependent dehydrogenase
VSDRDLQADVCIVGGGPAGTSLSQRLQQLGHSTVILERAAFPRRHIGVSLAGNTMALLGVLGVLERVEEAGFLRACGGLLRWGCDTEERSNAHGGLHVDRGKFDALMLSAALETGAAVFQKGQAMDVCRHDDQWTIRVATEKGIRMIKAGVLADASGRLGFIRGPRKRALIRTVALFAYWRNIRFFGLDTRVEAGAEAWYWSAPTSRSEFAIAAFVDGSDYRERLRSAGSRDALYNQLLSESVLLSKCGGDRVTNVFVCDATSVMRESPATPEFVSVGESAFTIDPLSSQGVGVAIGSSLLAAAMVNTMLRSPDRSWLAIDFYSRRIENSAKLQASMAARFYQVAAEFYGTPFWMKRAAGRTPAPPEPAAACEFTQTSTVAVNPDVRIVSSAAIVQDQIVPALEIRAPMLQSAVVFVAEVEVAPLLRLIQPGMSLADVSQVWGRHIPSQTSACILRWALENRVLEFSS